MLEYFLQEPMDEQGRVNTPKITNQLKSLKRLHKDIFDREMYATPNICHAFHNRVELKEALVNRVIEGTDALSWIAEKIPDFEFPTIDLFFCIKHERLGKIESHLWFFKGICNYLDPHMC